MKLFWSLILSGIAFAGLAYTADVRTGDQPQGTFPRVRSGAPEAHRPRLFDAGPERYHAPQEIGRKKAAALAMSADGLDAHAYYRKRRDRRWWRFQAFGDGWRSVEVPERPPVGWSRAPAAAGLDVGRRAGRERARVFDLRRGGTEVLLMWACSSLWWSSEAC